jgi:hypothetical protein
MFLVWKDERKRALGRSRGRNDVDIKINLQNMEWQTLGLIHMSLVGWLVG